MDVPITVRNKAMPVFEEQYYHTSIPEDLALHSAVRQIQAISPNGRELIYSIGEGDEFNQFDINPLTGMLTPAVKSLGNRIEFLQNCWALDAERVYVSGGGR